MKMAAVIVSSENRGIDFKKSHQTPKLTFKGRMENGRAVISARPELKGEIVFLSGGFWKLED